MTTFLELGIPSSESTVTVKAINLGALPLSSALPAAYFREPILPGYESFRAPIYAFFTEHRVTGKRLIHGHFDHTGEMCKFPATTELVIGPGFDRRTFPTTPESYLIESDLTGRKVTELNLNDFTLTIGDYEALDYFSDGSFYILNSPGHHAGHISVLARVTPTSFILLGGDSCHHIGQLRPTTELHKQSPCPVHAMTSRTTPLFSEQNAYGHADPEAARTTIAKLGNFDANPDVLVIVAHDATVPAVIDEFPKALNEWKTKGWKEKLTWAFLDRDFPALKT
ncbi:hypothetical protein EV421DRAFT_1903226 [Armillaria borealis]|uniref:Metallo-beta-lactamase domain-containing protein n=1 Tax=Armillaria borealis TaxID=47425 RepID=A0AA39JK41_9AGAR|nr:hypothetical protein EV421DRAFT_1903226 [Armillaria borealis]